MAPLISPMISGRCANSCMMQLWSPISNLKENQWGCRLLQILTNFPIKKSVLYLLLEDTFTHIWMIKSEILSSMILASWESICFPHTFHCAHLCHLLAFGNWLTTHIHTFLCTERLNKLHSQYPISKELLHISVPKGRKLWLQYILSCSPKARANLIKS